MHSNISLALELLDRKSSIEPNVNSLPSGFYVDPSWYGSISGLSFAGFRFVTLLFDGVIAADIIPCTRVTLYDECPSSLASDALVICLPTLSAVEWVNSLSQLEALMIRVDRPGALAITSVSAIGLKVVKDEKSFLRIFKRYCVTQKYRCTCLDMDEDILSWLKFPTKL